MLGFYFGLLLELPRYKIFVRNVALRRLTVAKLYEKPEVILSDLSPCPSLHAAVKLNY